MHGTQNLDHIKHMFFRRLPQNMPIIAGEGSLSIATYAQMGLLHQESFMETIQRDVLAPGFIYLHAKSSNGVVWLWMPHYVINLVMVGITRYLFAKGSNLLLSKDWAELLEDGRRWDELPSVFNEK